MLQNIQVYSCKSLEHLFALSGHVGAVTSLTWSPGFGYLLSSSEDGSIKIWDMSKRLVAQSILRHDASVTMLVSLPSLSLHMQ